MKLIKKVLDVVSPKMEYRLPTRSLYDLLCHIGKEDIAENFYKEGITATIKAQILTLFQNPAIQQRLSPNDKIFAHQCITALNNPVKIPRT